MPIGYLFSVEGEITKVKLSQTTVDDLPASIIGYEDQPSMYCESFPKNFFLMMHEDNDFPKNYKKSKLPINKALRLYFPNSPYKGNALLIKLTDGDVITKGNWSYSRLKQFRMGYSKTWKDDVNRPTVVLAKDASSLSEYPMIGETTEKGGNELKKCEKCGLVKTYFHYDECRIQQTKNIINEVKVLLETYPNVKNLIQDESKEVLEIENITWEKFVEFAKLQKKGLNQTGLDWINFHLKLFNAFKDGTPTTDTEKQIILDGILGVLYCYNNNSRCVFSDEGPCGVCHKNEEECTNLKIKGFEATEQNLTKMDYEHISEFRKMSSTVFPHLTISVFTQLFEQLIRGVKGGVTIEIESLFEAMIFSWATLLIKEHQFSRLLAEADNELFG